MRLTKKDMETLGYIENSTAYQYKVESPYNYVSITKRDLKRMSLLEFVKVIQEHSFRYGEFIAQDTIRRAIGIAGI